MPPLTRVFSIEPQGGPKAVRRPRPYSKNACASIRHLKSMLSWPVGFQGIVGEEVMRSVHAPERSGSSRSRDEIGEDEFTA
jgi:hypothetical protein